MIVKRYYAQDMPAAMAMIRAELGVDAVILSSKPVRKKGIRGLFQKKELEVVAAYEPRLESPRAKEERGASARRVVHNKVADMPVAPAAPMGPLDREVPAPPRAVGGLAAQAYQMGSRKEEQNPIEQALEAARAAQQRAHEREQREEEARLPDPIAWPVMQGRAEPAVQQWKAPIAKEPPEAAEQKEAAPVEQRQLRPTMQEWAVSASPRLQEEPQGKQQEQRAEEALAEETDERLVQVDQKLNEVMQLVGMVARRFEQSGGEVLSFSDEVLPLYHKLLEQDVQEGLARDLAMEVQQDKEASPKGRMRELVLRELGETGPLHFEAGKRRVLLFMGPTGVGKTTTLVKLVTLCSVRQGLKVGVINTDTYRIAAQEQLRIYADILEVPLEVAYSPAEIPEALDKMQDKDVIFIDTAGKRPGDAQHQEDMRELLLKAGKDAQVLVCIAAPTSARSAREIIKHYSFVDDYGMILTKIDEAAGLGAALNICSMSEKSLHYMTSGQSVPDDIEEADAQSIANRLLG